MRENREARLEMHMTSIAKLLVFSAVTWAVGMTIGCGLVVDIEGEPNPASVGDPLKYTMDVKFTETGTASNGAVLLLLFPGKGSCGIFDDLDRNDLVRGEMSLEAIEDRIPEEIMALLPEGVTLETLAARMSGAMQAATSESTGTCEKLVEDLGDVGELDELDFGTFACMLGDIASGETETVMAEIVPSKPGVLTALAIAAACDEDVAHEGTEQIFGDDDDDDGFAMCDGQLPDFIGIGCTQISVQGGFAAPAASEVGLFALIVLLAGIGVLTRRRMQS